MKLLVLAYTYTIGCLKIKSKVENIHMSKISVVQMPNRQTVSQANSQTESQSVSQTVGETNRQLFWPTDTQADRQSVRNTNKQSVRQIVSQSDINDYNWNFKWFLSKNSENVIRKKVGVIEIFDIYQMFLKSQCPIYKFILYVFVNLWYFLQMM